MNFDILLETLDYNAVGHIDLNSVHPNKLNELLRNGYVEEIDPMDGSNSYFIITRKAWEVLDGSEN